MNLENPSLAVHYLSQHKYSNPRELPGKGDKKITYHEPSGDNTWENEVASQNGWFRQEKSNCCYKWLEEKPNINFCGDCGSGANGNTVYRQDKSLRDLEQMFTTKESKMGLTQ